jgi:hypothetical protein
VGVAHVDDFAFINDATAEEDWVEGYSISTKRPARSPSAATLFRTDKLGDRLFPAGFHWLVGV